MWRFQRRGPGPQLQVVAWRGFQLKNVLEPLTPPYGAGKGAASICSEESLGKVVERRLQTQRVPREMRRMQMPRLREEE